MSKVVKLQASDGHEFDAYVAQPNGTPRAGLVVVQEIFGVNEHIRSVADRFAQEGFFAVAPAIFDRAEKHVELGYDGERHAEGDGPGAKDRDRQHGEGCGCSAALCSAQDREAGWRGGLLLWRNAGLAERDTAGAGGRSGLLRRPDREVRRGEAAGSCDASLREKGDHIPETDVAKVHAAHPEVEIYWYDAGHGFNCDMRGSYNEKASKEAMARTLAFFNKHL